MTRAWLFFVVVAATLGVASCTKPSEGAESKAIQVTADAKGFTPSSVTLPKDRPASLVFTRTTDETCAKEVVFPEINLKKDLPLNTPVTIDVPTTTARTLTFQCGMAMYKSKVVIQ